MPPPDAYDHRLRAGGAGGGGVAADVKHPHWRNRLQIKVSVYETLRLRHPAPPGKSFGIRPASCHRVAGGFEDDQGVSHPKLLDLSAQTRCREKLSVQLL